MGDFSIPAKPPMPESTDPKAMFDYQQKMHEYNMAISIIQHTMNQEETRESNQEKSRHDALMAVIHNMKSS